MHYILDADGEPQRCDDLMVWGAWFERASRDRSRIIAADKDEGRDGGGEILVSTVFLGLDHNFSGIGPPVLWETLVFGGPLDEEMHRYTSREAALAGHQAICVRLHATLNNPHKLP
jgi:hypothetical protein